MDNMLYIIAGLVIIFLIGILVLRKNKAQQPSTQQRQSGNNLKDNTQNVAQNTNQAKPAQNIAKNVRSSATKFDNLSVAQRFMDQQRYDKAIEAIKRGLNEKPHDSQLLLKLLNVYAITNQHDDFDGVYNTIKINADVATIDEAYQLKALLDQEQTTRTLSSPTFSSEDNLSVNSNMSLSDDITLSHSHDSATSPTNIDTTKDDISLDFDIPVQNELNAELPVVTTSDNDGEAFDFTLDDLETTELAADIIEPSIIEAVAIEPTTSNHSDFNFDESEDGKLNDDLNAKSTTTDDLDITNLDTTENIEDDFTLDFDLNSDTDLVLESAPIDVVQDDSLRDISLNDDFVLDFDDLIEETDNVNNHDTVQHQAIHEETTGQKEFTYQEQSTDQQSMHQGATSAKLAKQESSEDFTLLLEDNEVAQTTAMSDVTATIDTTVSIFDHETVDSDTQIDDLTDFDMLTTSATATTPVEAESGNTNHIASDSSDIQHEKTSPAIDFDVQFAADFDFVKTLDSNQVTLDLAGQYLQLGEYDSAKRLLNEVIAQGNSEQQNQAQELLTRTA